MPVPCPASHVVATEQRGVHRVGRTASLPWLQLLGPLLVLAALGFTPGLKAAAPPAVASPSMAADRLFVGTQIPEIRITIAERDLEQLRSKPRTDVPARVRSSDAFDAKATLHIKGRRGSVRPVDDKPSLTIDFKGTPGSPRFEGLRKIHLNNSVEDGSYLNEWLGALLFQRTGLAVPRVCHAKVLLNNRPLGLFVLKEGITDDYLERLLRDPKAVVYEPDVGHDVGETLAMHPRRIPQDWPSHNVLAEALQTSDLSLRLERVARWMDPDAFLHFMAMEVLLGHRDGYSMARNNYRLCYSSRTRQFLFLPQGMDQLFGTPELTWKPDMAGLAARALLEIPGIVPRYRTRLLALVTNEISVPEILKALEARSHTLQAALNAEERPAFRAAVEQLKQNLSRRVASLQDQMRASETAALSVQEGGMLQDHWKAQDTPEGGALGRVTLPKRGQTLHIQAGPRTSASWRLRLSLPPGRYEWVGDVKTTGVNPLPFGDRHGAGLRIAGTAFSSERSLTGDNDWTTLRVAFSHEAQEELELICELRGRSGDAWFALDSFRLKKL